MNDATTEDKMAGYMNCMGVKDENGIVVAPHRFYDGQEHMEGSHGICPECQSIYIKMINRNQKSPEEHAHE